MELYHICTKSTRLTILNVFSATLSFLNYRITINTCVQQRAYHIDSDTLICMCFSLWAQLQTNRVGGQSEGSPEDASAATLAIQVPRLPVRRIALVGGAAVGEPSVIFAQADCDIPAVLRTPRVCCELRSSEQTRH